MTSFPMAPIQANPYVPSGIDYERRAETLGRKVANVAQAGGQIWDKVNAYNALKEKMTNEKRFRTDLLSEIVPKMQEAGYAPMAIKQMTHIVANGDLDEAWQKATGLAAGLEMKKDFEDAPNPMVGEKDYETRIKELKAKKLSAKRQQAVKASGVKTREQAQKTALGIEQGTELGGATKQFLETYQKEITELDKMKIERDNMKSRLSQTKDEESRLKEARQYGLQLRTQELAIERLLKGFETEKNEPMTSDERLKAIADLEDKYQVQLYDIQLEKKANEKALSKRQEEQKPGSISRERAEAKKEIQQTEQSIKENPFVAAPQQRPTYETYGPQQETTEKPTAPAVQVPKPGKVRVRKPQEGWIPEAQLPAAIAQGYVKVQ